jgi:metal-responsive CopG/Arc/MetJ family transcriptional regulator
MQRTTIVAPQELLEELHRLAAQRRVSLAAVIREALEDAVKHQRPKPHGGVFDSGFTDTAERSGDWTYEPPAWR